MTSKNKINQFINGHRFIFVMFLCLFGLCVAQSRNTNRHRRISVDQRVYLEHSDELSYDEFLKPGVQVVKGHVSFRHQGAKLLCDSAYFNQDNNTFEAFGHVKMLQGDTLSLHSDYAYYDGMEQMVRARRHVVLRHRGSVLYTDSLDYDRRYKFGYFFEGGRLRDGKNTLVSDWGEYNTENREAVFYYAVELKSPKYDIRTDTLHYDTRRRMAHLLGPSTIITKGNVIKTNEGYYDTNRDKAKLYGRSTVINKDKVITGDSLYFDNKRGISEGYHNVVYVDKKNKNELRSGYCYYNEKKGVALATRKPVVKDYSQKDTLYVHADTIRMKTFHINTDSMYREVYCYHKVRAYRVDVQAVCDSLVMNSRDSCMTMYKDPIVWSANRQILGEVIKVYAADSTIKWAHVIGQALSVEQMHDGEHYNQVSSKEMKAFFTKGNLRKTEAISNVLTVYYPVDDKDSSLIGLNYLETDTMRMYLNEMQKLQKIWTSKSEATTYPMTQIPPGKSKLPSFAWFDYIRPVDKNDILIWRGKNSSAQLKPEKRREAPLQHIEADSAEDKGAAQ